MTQIPVPFVPLAPVQLVKPNGRVVGYGLGATSDAARGTALIAAQTAAASGDLIRVYASATVPSRLGKHGVDWWFAPVTISTTITGDLWGDDNTAMTFSVAGNGQFVFEGTGNGIHLQHASTIVRFHNLRMTGVVRVLGSLLEIDNGVIDSSGFASASIVINGAEMTLRDAQIITDNTETNSISGEGETITVVGPLAYNKALDNVTLDYVSTFGAGSGGLQLSGWSRLAGLPDLTPVGNVTTGEDDLITYTIPADTFATDGDRVVFEGEFLAVDQAFLKAYIGATSIAESTQGPLELGLVNTSTMVRLTLLRIDSDTLRITGEVVSTETLADTAGTGFATLPVEIGSLDFESTLAFKFTGEAVNTDDIEQLRLDGWRSPVNAAGIDGSEIGSLNAANITSGTLAIARGGTGAATAAAARANLGVNTRLIMFHVFAPTAEVVVGDGAAYFYVPADLNGYVITAVHAAIVAPGLTGTTDIQIARIRGGPPVDVLSTKLTIDSAEQSSDTALAPAVIDTANDDLAAGDYLRIDIDAVTSSAAPTGLMVAVEVTL